MIPQKVIFEMEDFVEIFKLGGNFFFMKNFAEIVKLRENFFCMNNLVEIFKEITWKFFCGKSCRNRKHFSEKNCL